MSGPRVLDLFCGAGSAAMGIDWMRKDELAEAIPPAYTTYLARQYGPLVALERAP